MTTMHSDNPEAHDNALPPAKKPGSSIMRSLLIGAGIGVAAVAVLTAVVVGVGTYKYGWHGAVSRGVLSVVPYPAATVNGSVVRLSTYVEDLEAIRQFFSKEKEQAGELAELPSDEELKKQVMDRLVGVEVLEAEAAKRNVSVSNEEVDAEFAKLTATGRPIEQEILDLYGWTTAQFKEKVIRPYLLTQKLAEALAKDPELAKAQHAKAEEVLAKLNAGEKFEDLAAQYSGDPTNAQNGGDLGWFGKGIMVQEFEDGVFALKKGETSGIIETKFGLHIVRLDDVKKKGTEVTEVQARHILIPSASIDEFLKEATDNAKVRKFVN